MFEHAVYRPLWPVILFLPWVLVGIAYLVESVLHLRSGITAVYHVRRLRSGDPRGGPHRNR
jgi:hypothetical protein